MRLEKLSAEQVALMPVWVEKWTKIGLSCEPLDYEAAVDAVNRAYAVAKLPPPEKYIVCHSPIEALIIVSVLNNVGGHVRGHVRDHVWSHVLTNVEAHVRDHVRDHVLTNVEAHVWDHVRGHVWNDVGGHVRDHVRDNVGGNCFGSHDADWLSFYDYLSCVGELSDLVEPLQPLIDLASHCGWWMPFANCCILQHRHSALHTDAAGRLHNDSGVAIEYPDGWGVHMWHGRRIPPQQAWIIEEPNRLTFSAIDAERNTEIRRVMLEIFGYDRYILESGMNPIQSDEYGELFRRELVDDEPLCMVRVVNSTVEPDGTFSRYMLRVPPTIRSAREAVAWTFDMADIDYAPNAQS